MQMGPFRPAPRSAAIPYLVWSKAVETGGSIAGSGRVLHSARAELKRPFATASE
jgi:hypothetical protein